LPTGAKEAEEHEQKWRFTQGVARLRRRLPWAGMLSRFQRFCRFAAWDAGRASGRLLASGDGAG